MLLAIHFLLCSPKIYTGQAILFLFHFEVGEILDLVPFLDFEYKNFRIRFFNFDDANAADRLPPRIEPVAPVNRSAPLPRATIAGTARRATTKAPKQLARQHASKVSSEVSADGASSSRWAL